MKLRSWQVEAIKRWGDAGHKGVVEVVTGGGKTIFALACIREIQSETSLIVVPTAALLDQWWVEAAAFFNLSLDEINILNGSSRLRSGSINIGVLNTVAKLSDKAKLSKCFLIIDECHRAGSPSFRSVLKIDSTASLGLSATPSRQYDDWFERFVIPSIGNVIFSYRYEDALKDGVIVPFKIKNLIFELETERQQEYDKLTKSIARSSQKLGIDAPETVALLLKRARVSNLSINRVKIALKVVARHRSEKILIFHEDVRACDVICAALNDNGISAGVYHSGIKLRDRAVALEGFRSGSIQVLVTCHALDEGFSVPQTQVGIIAASTASRRQRIQRLGRVLRPSANKPSAIVYTLAATKNETDRLREEEMALEGVADVSWSKA